MNPVVHFELPCDDAERMGRFYRSAFGWQTQSLGVDTGADVTAATTGTAADGRPAQPGAINAGRVAGTPDGPAQHPSVVIAVQDIRLAMNQVEQAGGQVLGEPMEIPGIGHCVSFMDTEANRVSLLQPFPRRARR